MATIGILGIGHLAGFLVEGLSRGDGADELILSPRNGDKARALAARFGARVAGSNQDVVDQSDLVLVCLPTATGHEILSGLVFREGQSVLSAMAGTSQAQLLPLVAPARAHVTMMPGAANALGCGPSLLYPADEVWHAVLSRLGPVIVPDSAEQYDIAAVFGGFSGASFAWMDAAVGWFEARGLSRDLAQKLIAATVRGNAEVVLQPGASLDEISKGVATPGGITRQVVDRLNADGALGSWAVALDEVLARIRSD